MSAEDIGWVISVCVGSFLVPFFLALIFVKGKDKVATAVIIGLLFGGGWSAKTINNHFHPPHHYEVPTDSPLDLHP